MVRRSFRHDDIGTALTEGLIVFPIVVLSIAALVEFGYMMYQWNVAAKAMQVGVRKLVVSTPVTNDFNAIFAFNANAGGQLITANSTTVSRCGGGYDPCDETAMTRLIEGNSDWRGLASVFPELTAEDVVVTYEQNGLGYQGRPCGPVVTVRMEIDRDELNLPITGALLELAGVGFPPFAVSATSEDLSTTVLNCS